MVFNFEDEFGCLLRLMQALRFCVLDEADSVLKFTYLRGFSGF